MVTPVINPYIGPRAFQEKDQALFFGRDNEARDLLSLVISDRFVLFYAPSGAGKSSLINTRLRPGLSQKGFEILPLGQFKYKWSDPIPNVNNIFIFNLIINLDQDQHQAERFIQTSLAEYLLQRQVEAENDNQSPETPQVLVIDQFEEIFTTHPEYWEQREGFFEQLRQAMKSDPLLWIVLVMREDYIAALDPYTRILPGKLRTRFYMQCLSPEAAFEAITKPAREAGRIFRPDAAQMLVDSLRQLQARGPANENQLGEFVEPVQLQVVCHRLWEQLPPETVEISVEDVTSLGNVEWALADYYAESIETIAADTPVSEWAIRDWIERHLITTQGFRGQVLQEDEASQGLDNRVIWRLVDAHLVHAERRRGATWFELAHDRLVEPVKKNNRDWREKKLSSLQRQAALWESQERSKKLLFQDDELEQAAGWATHHETELTKTDREFLTASKEAQAILNRERKQKRRIRDLAVFSTLTTIIILFLTFGIVIPDLQETRAAAATAEMEKQQVLAEQANRLADQAMQVSGEVPAQPQLGLLLAVEAISITSGMEDLNLPEVEETLRALVFQTGGRPLHLNRTDITAVAFSPDNTWLAMGNQEGTVNLWQLDYLDQQKEPRSLLGHEDGIGSLAFSPDGEWLATGSYDTSVRLWDMTNLAAEPIVLDDHIEEVIALAFSPNGQWLATGSRDKTVRLWDMTRPPPESIILRSHTGEVSELAFSPDGRWLATGSYDKTVRLWDMTNLAAEPIVLQGHTGEITTLAFSPDGLSLATGSRDQTVRLWEPANTLPIEPVIIDGPGDHGHQDTITGVAFSPDGRWLATASEDNIRPAQLWNLANPANTLPEPLPLLGHNGGVNTVIFNRDGTLLATGGSDRTIHLYDPAAAQRSASPIESALLHGHEGEISAIAFSSDNRWLASGAYSDMGRLWNLAKPKPATLPPDLSELVKLACQTAGRNLTEGEWVQYMSSQEDIQNMRKTCPELPLQATNDPL